MTLPTIHGEYRVVDDPELRFTPSGTAVANLRVVANSRKKDERTQEWVDDKVVWLNVTVWQRMAENVAESLTKGSLVIVIGRLETRAFETREGEKRQSFDVTADFIGPSLTWDPARILKSDRQATAGQGNQGARQAAAGQENQDPWATPAGGSDEPPF